MTFEFNTEGNQHHLWVYYNQISEINICGSSVEITVIGNVFSSQFTEGINPKELGYNCQRLHNNEVFTEIHLDMSVNELVSDLLFQIKWASQERHEIISDIQGLVSPVAKFRTKKNA